MKKNSVKSKVFRSISAQSKGQAFCAIDFLRFGQQEAINQALHRLAAEGRIRRVAQGVYNLPARHPTLGELPPRPEEVAQALARKQGHVLQMSGAAAANALGLSTQVPARIVYLTSGTGRSVRVGNRTVEFRRTSPLLAPGTQVGNVFQAVKHLKRLSRTEVKQLRAVLSKSEKGALAKHVAAFPVWAREGIRSAVAPDLPTAA